MALCPTSVRLARINALHLTRARGLTTSLLSAGRVAAIGPTPTLPAHPSIRNLATVAWNADAQPDFTVPKPEPPPLLRKETDIAIVGAGPAGLAVACGLAHEMVQSGSQTGVRLTVLEASFLDGLRAFPNLPGTQDELPWSNRVVSVTAQNMAWLESLGVTQYLIWSRIRAMIDMHVSDSLAPAGTELHFDAADLAEDDPGTWATQSHGPTHVLSYLVEISNLQHAMLTYLSTLSTEHVNVSVRDATRVADIVAYDAGTAQAQPVSEDAMPSTDQWPVLTLSPKDAPQEWLATRLVVGADSPRGPVGKYAQIGAFGHQYNRRGLVSTLRCVLPPPPPPGFGGVREDEMDTTPSDPNDPHAGHQGHTSWQRFLPSGPIAFLPLGPKTGSMVWTLPPPICGALEWINRSTTPGTPVDPLAELVSAAFRLPWDLLQPVLEATVIEHRHALAQKLEGQANTDAAAQAGRSTVTAIAEAVQQAGGLTSLPAYPPGEAVGSAPPPIRAVENRSVASFPLQVRHVDGYTGASLTYAPSSALAPKADPSFFPPLPLPLPSDILATALGALGVAPEAAGKNAARPRTVLVGDAAHSTHPLAGQGLNLGLADARALSSTLATTIRGGGDVGSGTALAPYPKERYAANQVMLSAADHIHWLFGAGGKPSLPVHGYGVEADRIAEAESGLRRGVLGLVGDVITYARGAGMDVLNEIGPAKRFFMQNAGGGRAVRTDTKPKQA